MATLWESLLPTALGYINYPCPTGAIYLEAFLTLISQYGTLVYLLLFAYCALKSGSLPLFGGYAAHTGALDPLKSEAHVCIHLLQDRFQA